MKRGFCHKDNMKMLNWNYREQMLDIIAKWPRLKLHEELKNEALENVKNKESEGTSKIVKAMADESKALETVASIDNSLFKGRSEMNAMFSRRSASVVRAPSKVENCPTLYYWNRRNC